jgi:transcriptional regulator with XRE-family HTH domain
MVTDLGTVWHVDVKTRVKALRTALGLSQEELAKRAAHGWHRVYISKIERGDNAVTSYEAREALAQGFGLPISDLVAYLEGRLTLEQATARRKAAEPASPTPEPPVAVRAEPSSEPRPPTDDADPLELALFAAMDPKQFAPSEFDGVRQAMRESSFLLKPEYDLVEMAREWLVAARQLRREGHKLTTAAITAQAAIGKSPHARKVAAEIDAGFKKELDERTAKLPVDAEGAASIKGEIAANLKRMKPRAGGDE